MGFLYGRAGRVTGKNGGFSPGQWLRQANAAVDKYAGDPAAGFGEAADESAVETGGGAPPGTFILSREEVLRSNGDAWPAAASPRLKGGGTVLPRRRMGGLYMLPGDDGDPFRRMLDHPEIRRRLDWCAACGRSTACQDAHPRSVFLSLCSTTARPRFSTVPVAYQRGSPRC
jgi:hypothetical protein